MNFYDTSLFQVVSIILFINVITGAPSSLNTILQSSNCQKNISIAIIGAGFAGLAASKKLRAAGFQNVDIFEAENRIGGRVYPIPIADGFLQQGAEYINGQANPIYEIASRLGVVDKEVPDYDPNEDPDYWSGKCNIPE
uniref:Amine oxidase domain-containing protein n=1 Tax=Acrobeloides nanus TaxID=290746 RepID=A0A914EA09_9BILA